MNISSHDHLRTEVHLNYVRRFLASIGITPPDFEYTAKWDAATLNGFSCTHVHEVARAINVYLVGLTDAYAISLPEYERIPIDLGLVQCPITPEIMDFATAAIHAARHDPWISTQATVLSLKRVHIMPNQAALQAFIEIGPWEPGEIAILDNLAFISHSHGQGEYLVMHRRDGTIGAFGRTSELCDELHDHLENYIQGARMMFDAAVA